MGERRWGVDENWSGGWRWRYFNTTRESFSAVHLIGEEEPFDVPPIRCSSPQKSDDDMNPNRAK